MSSHPGLRFLIFYHQEGNMHMRCCDGNNPPLLQYLRNVSLLNESVRGGREACPLRIETLSYINHFQ